VCTEAETGVSKDGIADRELTRAWTERFDRTRELTAENRLPRSAQSRDEAADDADEEATVAIGIPSRTVGSRDRRGVNPNQYFVILRLRSGDLRDAQHLWGSVPVVDNGLHQPALYLTR
jgi:hypothetical protein